MLAQFSIYPLDSVHMTQDIATVVEILERFGINYRLGPMGTCVEGGWEQVMAAIRACRQTLNDSHRRVITTIVIDDRQEGAHHLDEMIASVESRLGRFVKH